MAFAAAYGTRTNRHNNFGHGTTFLTNPSKLSQVAKTAVKWTIIILTMISVYVYLYSVIEFRQMPSETADAQVASHVFPQIGLPANISTAQRLRRIMMWTGCFGSWYGNLSDSRSTEELVENCSATCLVTNDRRLLPYSDVVLFHARDIHDVPAERYPWQKWVFCTLESPHNTWDSNFKYTKYMFNWTMTYRSDSDVYVPYGKFRQRNSTVTSGKAVRALWKSKQKMALWLVSNCESNSKREDFVTELKRSIDVDVYGDCGTYKCSKSQKDICYKRFARSYFYILAFENSLCVDYVTEKLFNALKYDIVPVVLGGANYSAIAPSNSYIDALAFHSPKHLAEYLVAVSENYTAYVSYFKWKESQEAMLLGNRLCELCKKMQGAAEMQRTSLYEDIRAWWDDGGRCRSWIV